MAPVSITNETGLPSTVAVTLGSSIMMFRQGMGAEDPRCCYSVATRPMRSVSEGSLEAGGGLGDMTDLPCFSNEVQSILQCPHFLHLGHGPGGGRGLGHSRAQCPSLPHLKHGTGGCHGPDVVLIEDFLGGALSAASSS